MSDKRTKAPRSDACIPGPCLSRRGARIRGSERKQTGYSTARAARYTTALAAIHRNAKKAWCMCVCVRVACVRMRLVRTLGYGRDTDDERGRRPLKDTRSRHAPRHHITHTSTPPCPRTASLDTVTRQTRHTYHQHRHKTLRARRLASPRRQPPSGPRGLSPPP